mgnify:CR=1 FL=1
MRILGIESASLVASVAIVTDDVITAEYTVNLKKTHSQTLLPMIDEIVKMLEVPLESIDAIAVSGGPGWLCDSEGAGTGAWEAAEPCADDGCDGILSVRGFGAHLPDAGCETAAGVHGALSV